MADRARKNPKMSVKTPALEAAGIVATVTMLLAPAFYPVMTLLEEFRP